jgi:hypothetical protein
LKEVNSYSYLGSKISSNEKPKRKLHRETREQENLTTGSEIIGN